MTQANPVTGDGADRQLKDDLERQIHRYAVEIEAILDRVNSGEFGEVAALGKLKRDLISTVKQYKDVEVSLAKDRRAENGRRSDHDIDFDTVRRDLGRRLDRLRATAGTK